MLTLGEYYVEHRRAWYKKIHTAWLQYTNFENWQNSCILIESEVWLLIEAEINLWRQKENSWDERNSLYCNISQIASNYTIKYALSLKVNT